MLQLETIDNVYYFHSYEERSVKLIKPAIHKQENNNHSKQPIIENALLEISSTIIIYKNQLENNNLPDSFLDFDQKSIEILQEYSADVYLIGTGVSLNFPDKEILQYISKNKLPIEFMDTGAVCRTFNILTTEYRNVAAMIFFK